MGSSTSPSAPKPWTPSPKTAGGAQNTPQGTPPAPAPQGKSSPPTYTPTPAQATPPTTSSKPSPATAAHGTTTTRAIALVTGETVGKTRHHLHTLEDAGIITRTRGDNGTVIWALADQAVQA